MKTKRLGQSYRTITGMVLVLGVATLCASAQEVQRYRALPRGSKATVTGTSTIHNWDLVGELVGGYLEVPAAVQLDSSQAELAGASDGKVLAKSEVSIPITSLKAPYEGMDNVSYDALNSKEHPRIQFHLTGLALQGAHAAGTPFAFTATGDLIVNGVTNAITMPVTIETTGPGKLKIAGQVPLKMTDYKVTPPVKLGVFRTGDEITVSFVWLVGLPAKAKL